MAKYVVKHASIMLPMASPNEAGKTVLKDQVVDLDDKLAEHFLKFGAVEAVKKTDAPKEEKEETPAPRGRRRSTSAEDS